MALLSDFRQPSLNPAQSATTVQGDQAARVGSSGAAIQNVLSFLNGGLLNELQYSGGRAAIDSVLSLLEREGIAQTLSSPSLTVLSGELAQVQFAAAYRADGCRRSEQPPPRCRHTRRFQLGGILVPFGVQLQIRPSWATMERSRDVQPP